MNLLEVINENAVAVNVKAQNKDCLLYTSVRPSFKGRQHYIQGRVQAGFIYTGISGKNRHRGRNRHSSWKVAGSEA